jgi:hypothetical protein
MAIKGLTDQGASFPQIGTLRKGGEKGERGPGRDLDHFRFDTDHDDARALFTAAYGSTPRAVNVYLPYETTDQNFSAWREHWVGGGLVHRCDGEVCQTHRTRDGRYSKEPVACPDLGKAPDVRDRCKPVGRLQVIIPELRRLAYVMALTTSINDIKNLHQQLLAIELSAGSLRGIPLVLRRSPVMVSMPDGKGGRKRVEQWLLSIEAAPRWVGLQLGAQEQRAFAAIGSGQALALPAPQIREVAPGRFVDEGVGEVLEAEDDHMPPAALDYEPEEGDDPPAEPEQPAPAAAARSTDLYVSLGKKLKGYGYTNADLKQHRVAWKLDDVAAMPDDHYSAVIAAMQEMERQALLGKGPTHVQAAMAAKAEQQAA